jgi:outer membrane protein OmpA-like peptidoglycan-associated protein
MMTFKTSAMAAAALALGALSLGGCATEGYVNKHVAVVQDQVNGVQGQVQAHDAHLAQLDQSTQDALNRANAAGKLAEGKFLYAVVLSDDSIKFNSGGWTLSGDGQAKLAAFVDKLKADNHNVYVEVQGHTDSTGPKDFNYRLGEARAEAVRLYLNKQGVALNRMATISYGPDSPVQSNKTKAGRAANRRVVLIVLA